MFYIGQKVVALVSYPDFGLIKDSVYTVVDILSCSCGNQFISCGENNLQKMRKRTPVKFSDWVTDSKNFAPLESYRESFSIAMELVQEMEQVDKQKVFNPKKIEACITTPTQKQAKH